jgi:hypothetical protein
MNLLPAQAAPRAACSWPAARPWPWRCRHRTAGADRGRARQRAARGPARRGDVALPARWSWPRSRAPTPSCTCRPPWASWWPAPGVRVRLGALSPCISPAQVHVFDARGELLLARNDREALRWPASNSTWRTPTSPGPDRQRLRPAAAVDDFEDGGAYALLGPRAAARPPCSTSCRACWCPRRARCCSTAAT